MKVRVGFGYDVHRLVEGRELWLGGVSIEYSKGLDGHSDADVLLHAICDALLGAANLRDIGFHFPDNAKEYKNIDSKILLRRTFEVLSEKGFSVGNIDATVTAEQPKINPHIPQMQEVIAEILEIDVDDISIKATTSEKMGFVGREEGFSAYAVALIQKFNDTMSRTILIELTADGSDTLFVPSINEHYHSINGAIQESLHVYIGAGLKKCLKKEIQILEVGFGTGLNALLTYREALHTKKIYYTGLELYPLSKQIIQSLNYTKGLTPTEQTFFYKLHNVDWGSFIEVTPFFNLKKIQTDFTKLDFKLDTPADLIYFDAFAPEKQEDMWSQQIFDFLYTNTNSGGILTTYCAKGIVRRMLQQAGYSVERIQGPPGKREMLRATKRY